jgi:viroplasmin and RNaseH domain-containing protein
MVFFYAVQGGRCSGIFTWDRMLDATVGYPDAKINRFPTLAKAEAFMKENPATPTQAPRWSGPAYAVAVGRRMGIFRDHAAALRQTLGYSGNSLKKFDSFEEGLDRHN